MRYLNSESLIQVGLNWEELVETIEEATLIKNNNNYSQPVKPYLRFNDPKNRIIAMPAYLGENISKAGIKWIASFPDNINKNLSRANSLTVLNNSETGAPECIINTTLISEIRTAAVTGAMIKTFLENRNDLKNCSVGISGFGPIGKIHIEMLLALFDEKISQVKVFDIRDVSSSINNLNKKISIADSLEEAFLNADIFITATVSKTPYINLKPKKGSLHLNVSLRDYDSSFIKQVSKIIVDDWVEVCRENTDIEKMHINEGLKKEDTLNIDDVLILKKLNQISQNDVIMFNPMGMAIFDIAIAAYYYNKANKNNIGLTLEG